MKKTNTKMALATFILSSLALVACGNGGGDGPAKKNYVWKATFKTASGEVFATTGAEKDLGPIDKPEAEPTQEGKKFFGWMNVEDGNQIWNFDNSSLNICRKDMEFVPCFVDANAKDNRVEAELAPEIPFLNGSTYSGGNYGRGLVYQDTGKELLSDCNIDPFKYYEVGTDYIVGEDPDDSTNTKTAKTNKNGYSLHFNYVYNNVITLEIDCDAAVTGVDLFGRFSGEYGHDGENGNVYLSFTKDQFKIELNDEQIDYSTVTINNIVNKEVLPYADYFLKKVDLKAGKNVLKCTVNNQDALFGSVASTAPCIDCFKFVSSTELACSNYAITNICR